MHLKYGFLIASFIIMAITMVIAPPVSTSNATGTSGSTATSSSSSSNGSSGATNGKVSFYTEYKTGKGSCGYPAGKPQIAALPPQYMPGKCGQCIQVTYNGKSTVVQATDTCPGCASNQLDLSDVAFQQLSDLSAGILQVTWNFVSCPANINS